MWFGTSLSARPARLRLFAQADLSFGGEIGGKFLGYISGGGPFDAALEGDDETDAALGGEVFAVVMAEGGVEDASLAKGDGHEEGLVFAGAAGFFGGEGAGEDGDIFGRAAETILDFVFGVQQKRCQAICDGMGRFACFEDKFVLFAVAAAFPRSFIAHPFSIAQAQVRAGLLVASFPAADGNHAIVIEPAGK